MSGGAASGCEEPFSALAPDRLIPVDRKLSAGSVVNALTGLFIPQGLPSFMRSDSGPAFVARAMRDWIKTPSWWIAAQLPAGQRSGQERALPFPSAQTQRILRIAGSCLAQLPVTKSCPADGLAVISKTIVTPSTSWGFTGLWRLVPDLCWQIHLRLKARP